MERVTLYKYVIEKNKKPKQSKNNQNLSTDVNELDYKNVERVKNKIVELQNVRKNEETQLDFSVIYHMLQVEVQVHEQFKEDKKYVKELVKNDILRFQA